MENTITVGEGRYATTYNLDEMKKVKVTDQTHFLCHIKKGSYKQINGEYLEHRDTWAVYDTAMKGYEWATEKYPLDNED